MRYGVVVPNFSTPERLIELGVRSERHGFDGFFLWDHVYRNGPPRPLSDTWTTLAALAMRTERVRLGSWVTPLPRRRAHVLARQVVTVDHLSGGRVVLGVGLGSQGAAQSLDEFSRFGEDPDPRHRAVLMDESLHALSGYFSGTEFSYEGTAVQARSTVFVPRPLQASLPVWAACEWPRRTPLRRAARVDGFCPIKIVEGEYRFMTPDDVHDLRVAVEARRGADAAFDIAIVAGPPPRAGVSEFEEAGATWLLMGTEGDPGWEVPMAELIRRGPTALA